MDNRIFRAIKENIYNTWHKYKKFHYAINVFLFILLILVAFDFVSFITIFVKLWDPMFLMKGNQYIDPIAKLSSILRDFFYISALIVAAIWTYYTFLKGRTFVPKLNIHIDIKDVIRSNPSVVIISIKIENIGRIKTIVDYDKTTLYYAYMDREEIKYKAFHEKEKMFVEHLDKNEYVFFEPKDESTIDICFPLDMMYNNREKQISKILMVKTTIKSNSRMFREISIFNLKNERR